MKTAKKKKKIKKIIHVWQTGLRRTSAEALNLRNSQQTWRNNTFNRRSFQQRFSNFHLRLNTIRGIRNMSKFLTVPLQALTQIIKQVWQEIQISACSQIVKLLN